MNVRNWPMGQIMQLPDNCFGQRWPVHVGVKTTSSVPHYDISESGLPERCVIWGFYIVVSGVSTSYVEVTFALGDMLPTTEAEFGANEMLFHDLGVPFGAIRFIRTIPYSGLGFIPMRKYVAAGGRRLIGRFDPATATLVYSHGILIVSGVPTEVPDCLLSG